jgi:dihydrofolate reductase
MSTVILHMSMSLDGLVTGPDDDLAQLHEWSYPRSGTLSDTNRSVVEELFATAAVVMGWRTFDLGAEVNGWYDNPPFKVPMFVPARSVPDRDVAANLTFVTSGVAGAVEQAKAAAGDGTVTIAGGATTIQEALNAGLVDELRLTHVPVVLGEGIRLFDHLSTLPLKLGVNKVVPASDVTHVTYRVLKDNS